MKIIDNHNHLWVGRATDGFLNEAMGEKRLLEDMDKAGVDIAGVTTVAQSMNNEYVLECIQRHPDRLFGFCMINPYMEKPVDTLKYYLDKGMKGLKLHPRLHGYQLGNHELVDPLLEVCREYKVPVFAHGGSEEMNHPFYFEELARSFPDVPIILGHMCMPNYTTDAKLVASRNSNIYLDNSVAEYLSCKTALKQIGPERIVMGTDWPGGNFELSILKTKLASQGDERAFELMAGGNIARLLNLKV